jgi:hypothetical protein
MAGNTIQMAPNWALCQKINSTIGGIAAPIRHYAPSAKVDRLADPLFHAAHHLYMLLHDDVII